MNKTVSNFLIGFLAGVAAGAIAGVLFAPDKGSKTRQNIRNKVRDLSDEYGLNLDELIDDFEDEPEVETEPVAKTSARNKKSGKSDKSTKPKRKYTRKPTND